MAASLPSPSGADPGGRFQDLIAGDLIGDEKGLSCACGVRKSHCVSPRAACILAGHEPSLYVPRLGDTHLHAEYGKDRGVALEKRFKNGVRGRNGELQRPGII